MALFITIALVAVLVAIRLTIPPWPNFLKISTEHRWGKRTTVVLFAIAVAGALTAIIISRP